MSPFHLSFSKNCKLSASSPTKNVHAHLYIALTLECIRYPALHLAVNPLLLGVSEQTLPVSVPVYGI